MCAWITKLREEEPSWKCNCHTSPLRFQKPISIRVFHNTPPTPNNNITITLNHTVLSQPPWGKAWKWTESECIFVPLCADGQKATFLAYICLPLKKKKMLPYISASHLVCIGGTMQLTPVCQWRFWRINALRMQEKRRFYFFFISLCWYLDGMGKTRMGARTKTKKM